MFKIPLSVPIINGNELEYIKECLDTEWVSSAGKYVDLFEENISKYTNSKFTVASVNGTSALQVSLRLAGVMPDDEVIIPTLTFIAPVNAISYNYAKPIFMDVDNYYNIDSEKTIDFIKNETFFKNGFTYNKVTNKKISALVPVHIWGNAVWLDELVDICNERNIRIVEDASESLGTFYSKGNYKEKHSGTIGDIGCISFNGNKIITTGGGGMILTENEKTAEKARYLTTQAKDDPLRYIHNDIGYNFRLTNIQAALGVAQLEQLPKFLERNNNNYIRYNELLKELDGLVLAKVPNYARNNHWMNLLQIESKVNDLNIEQIMKKLSREGIETRPVWELNHKQRPYLDCQTYYIDNAEKIHKESLCLPSGSNLRDKDIQLIIKHLVLK